MSHTQSDVLARCIAELESRTRAEVVIVLQGASGNYRDVDHRVGAILSFAFLLFAILSPTEIHPAAIPLPLLLLYGLGLVTTRYTPLRAWLTRRTRQERQVLRAAEAQFCRLKVHQTRSQTGVLIYSSRLEGRTIILSDQGAESAFPDAIRESYEQKISEACHSVKNLEFKLGAVLRTLGVHLEHQLPPEDDTLLRTNELPDHAHLSQSTEDELA